LTIISYLKPQNEIDTVIHLPRSVLWFGVHNIGQKCIVLSNHTNRFVINGIILDFVFVCGLQYGR